MTKTTPEVCEECGLPIEWCNANALVRIEQKENARLEAKLAAKDARIARLKAALALLTYRSAGLIYDHHHGNGLEGWYDKIDGVVHAIKVARGALEDVQ